MSEELCRAGEKHDVDFFVREFSWDKSYLYETNIIGTKGAIEHLKKSGIKEGANKSLFFESQRVFFCDIEDEAELPDIITCYFTGGEKEYKNICAFKAELIDKYGGGFPKANGFRLWDDLKSPVCLGRYLLHRSCPFPVRNRLHEKRGHDPGDYGNQSFQYADLSGYFSMKYPFVVINRNSFRELARQYPQLAAVKETVEANKISLLFPASIKEGSADYENAREYYKNEVGFLFQNFALMENKTVRQNLEIVKSDRPNDISMEEALYRVDLEDKIDSKIYTLPGGEQQRIALARLILKQCNIILADEPTGSLDKRNARVVIGLLKELNQEGKTVIIVTHDEEIKNQAGRRIEL